MTRETLITRLENTYGVSAEYPWQDHNAVFRHRENRKWFAAVLEVRRDRLGLSGSDIIDVVNLKIDPRLIGSLVLQDGFHRAYHMNKEKWISVRLDDSVPDETLQALVAMSYDLTAVSVKRRK